LISAELSTPEPELNYKDGVSVWYHLGVAYWKAGNFKEAADRFNRIAESGLPRAGEPIQFVRSFYYLGSYYDKIGEHEKARENFQRFLSYWDKGNLDRDKVEEASRYIGS
jgi:tetratricopeptide (TPR) repeat protein